MARLAVITKSYAPDYELCALLNQSVLENSPETIYHYIIVPWRDLTLFRRLASSRTHIRCELDFLPRTFIRVPFSNVMVNLRKPFPPVRGWIQQQAIKLAAIAASEDDAILVADSDVEFIRPFTAKTFVRNGVVRFFCKPDEIRRELSRHMTWHQVARELLALPPAEPPYPDYISSPLAWDPGLVRQMLARVEATAGRPWLSVIAGQLDFSECVLYGVFLDGVMGAPANSFASDDSLCLVHWQHTPLNIESAPKFIERIRPTHIAAVVQSKSRTPPEVRKTIFASLRAAQNGERSLQGAAEEI